MTSRVRTYHRGLLVLEFVRRDALAAIIPGRLGYVIAGLHFRCLGPLRFSANSSSCNHSAAVGGAIS